MPTSPPRPCTNPRCPNLTPHGRCPTCRTQAEQQRGTAAQRGYNARWRRFRTWYLTQWPTCTRPDCDQPAEDINHLDGQGPNGPHGYDPNWCEGLCHPHHSQWTAQHQPGGINQR